jgi:hypothetical protein
MDYISWRNIRKGGYLYMYLCYGVFAISLIITIAGHFSLEHIYSDVWIGILCVHLCVKCPQSILEAGEKFVSVLKFVNFCEYMLFVTGNILFVINYNEDNSEDGFIRGIMIMLNVCACNILVFILIAAIYEWRGYNLRLKDLIFDILSFEIVTLLCVIFLGILKCEKHYEFMTDRLLPNNNAAKTNTTINIDSTNNDSKNNTNVVEVEVE